jgi:hypothetical protein
MSNISTPVTANAVPTNVSTESVVLVLPFSSGASANPVIGVGQPSGQAKNLILGSMNITPGAGTTAVVVRCRQGNNTVTGTPTSAAKTVTLVAGSTAEIPLCFQDTAAPAGGEPYSITVTQTGGTAAGTVNTITAYTSDYS